MIKNLLFFLLVFLFLIACNQGSKNKTTTTTRFNSKKNNQPYNNPLFKEYSSFLSKLDTSNIENSTIAVKKFVELFKNQKQNVCDTAFMLFDSYYGKLSNTIEDLPLRDTSIKYDSLLTDSNSKNISNLSVKLQLIARKLKENGVMVYMSEGDVYIGQDLDFVARWFYGHVSPAMKEYLAQLNIESKQRLTDDAALTIGPDQLAERTIWWERFSSENPNIIISASCKNNWIGYLSILFEGMDNSPILDYGSQNINPYFKTAYSYLQKNFPDSKTNKLINPYFNSLARKDTVNAKKLISKYRREGFIQD
ncbi:hypothetical protein [Mucilaginibacter sp.]|uniref:hypothetical protein n=1 Tax=Mucilaginibacter sp. TaxID=1882438 RepID=UPI00284706CF|nr:hypothetical protein [Mucilaginibacter sp.]MDR3693647.1 hypothetical protein [Mucilaginibacter sp.]